MLKVEVILTTVGLIYLLNINYQLLIIVLYYKT